MDGPQLLFIKIVNTKNTKILNGTNGALICDVTIDGVDYSPIDVILRRPKSDHGLQKNTLVFQLPTLSPKFDITFTKKTSQQQQQDLRSSTSSTTSPNKYIIAKTSVSLQYSTLPGLPRRSSFNSLSVLPQLQQSPRTSPKLSSSGNIIIPGSPNQSSNNFGSPSSPSSPISIQQQPNATYSPVLSGSPSIISSSPQFYSLPPPYSLNIPSSSASSPASSSPLSLDPQKAFQATPIYASTSTSSPTLATVSTTEEEIGRIDSSLKWYRLSFKDGPSADQQLSIPPPSTTIVPSTSTTSFTNLDTDTTYTSDDPEVQLQISYEQTNLPALIRLKAVHKDLLDLVVTPKLQLVHSICDAVDITAAQQLAKSLVDVFHSHHKLLHLLKSFIKKEVSQCHDPGTLFRSNSVAMKMVVAYGHKTAQHYLQQTLTPLVVELCNSPLSLEVDPVKLSPGEDSEANLKNLRVVSQKFFDRIVASIDSCPKSIVEICYYFKKIVSRKFPSHWKAAVGGFIFLRLLCPACVSPENAGIVSAGRVGISERRALVLVAKCLQNLSNQATFNQTYMESINDFITGNIPALEEFFSRLASRPSEDHTIDGMMVSEDSLYDGINYIHQFIEKNQDKVHRILTENYKGGPQWERVMECVELSKKAVLSTPTISMLLHKQRSNSAGNSPTGSPSKEKKVRSNSDTKGEKWSSNITKNLKIAKQTVITPTLNAISNIKTSSDEEIKIINNDHEWKEPSRSAHIVVQYLLKTVINIIKSNKLSDTQSIKFNGQPLNWAQVQQTPEFAQFHREVAELQNITFDVMSPEYIASFFINAFNLMILHLHFLVGPPNSEVRRKSYQAHRYNIGGDLYSLADIQQGILRSNPKNQLTRVRQIRSGDHRRKFVIPLDPRYHFVMFAVNITLPVMRIMVAETLVEDLHCAGEEFCSSKMDICLKKKEISLPKLFSQYGTDFGKSRSEMLKWLFQFLTSAKRTELIELLEKPSYICLYRSESWYPVTYKTKFVGEGIIKSPSLLDNQNNNNNDQLNVNIQQQQQQTTESNDQPISSSPPQQNITTLLVNNDNSQSNQNDNLNIPIPTSTTTTPSSATATATTNNVTFSNQTTVINVSSDDVGSTASSSASTNPNTNTNNNNNQNNNNNNNTNNNSNNNQYGTLKPSTFDKDKALRRKSRSLTHGNRMAPAKKDSTALTLINSLRLSAQASTKSILSSLNDVVKRIADSIDIGYVKGILDILKKATRQLSFHEWQKSSTMGGMMGSGLSTEPVKPSLNIKPTTHLFSNHQSYCLSPSSLASYAPTFQEIYALTLAIEKETNKFVDFMDIASFSQSNDISELLADVAEQMASKLREYEGAYNPLESVKSILDTTIVYFKQTVANKLTSINTASTMEDIQMTNILKELIIDSGKPQGNSSNSNLNNNNNKDKDINNLINKLTEISEQIKKAINMAELSPVVSRIERIGRMVNIISEQQVGSYSPRQSPRNP